MISYGSSTVGLRPEKRLRGERVISGLGTVGSPELTGFIHTQAEGCGEQTSLCHLRSESHVIV